MRKTIRRLRDEQSGQGMTEYIIIVALVAIFAILAVTLFGDNIKALFAASANALAGQPESVETEKASTEHTASGHLKKSWDDLPE